MIIMENNSPEPVTQRKTDKKALLVIGVGVLLVVVAAIGIYLFIGLGKNGTSSVPEERQLPPSEQLRASGGCVIGGCSGQLCLGPDEEDVFTTCEFSPVFTCYQNYGTCQPQADGQCGWSQTSELASCLANPPDVDRLDHPSIYGGVGEIEEPDSQQ